VLDPIIDAAFDPAWNASHRGLIWATIMGVLFLSGIGLPIPEDIPLTAAGFTTLKAAGDDFTVGGFVLAFVAVTLPILIGDVCAYSLGRRFGFFWRNTWPFRSVFSEARLTRVQRWFDEYGSPAVFLGRQVAGVRFVTFYTAGTMRMNVVKFVFWDFLGCVVSIPVWLTLGALAARYGRTWLDAASSNVGIAFLVVVAALALMVYLKSRAAPRRV
jgi:membrane protein DedA with SNARE-associated domain